MEEKTKSQYTEHFLSEAKFLISKFDDEFYNQSLYLPKSLKNEFLKMTIFQINRTIGILINDFDNYEIPKPIDEDSETDEEVDYKIRNYDSAFISYMQYVFDYFDFDLAEEYKKEMQIAEKSPIFEDWGKDRSIVNLSWYSIINVEKEIKDDYYKPFITIHEIDKKSVLEKFEDVIYFFGLILFYNSLLSDYETISNGGEVDRLKDKNNLIHTNLTFTQRGKLFDLLVSNGFIHNTNKDGFIWAFGSEKDNQPSNWQPVEWIDKSITRKEPNIQTLFELLYLLGVDKDTSANNKNNLYRKMEFCFCGLVNIASKNPTAIQQKTERQRLLKSIIEEIRKVEV